MHLYIPIRETVVLSEKGVSEKVQTVTFNSTLMALVRYALDIECGGELVKYDWTLHINDIPYFSLTKGCPQCQIACNSELKEKLRKCFPDIKPDRYASFLASEKGR